MEVLERALAILDDGRCWNRGAYAVDGAGQVVPTGSDEAERFCLVGATYRAAIDLGDPQLFRVGLDALHAQTGWPNSALWNDEPERTWGQVNEVFRRACAETHAMEPV